MKSGHTRLLCSSCFLNTDFRQIANKALYIVGSNKVLGNGRCRMRLLRPVYTFNSAIVKRVAHLGHSAPLKYGHPLQIGVGRISPANKWEESLNSSRVYDRPEDKSYNRSGLI